MWMRTAALPSFRKLYGRIEEDLDEGDLLEVHIMNNYNTYSFGGKKKLVLSTLSWLGGKNDFLGLAYVFIGCSSIIISIVFMLLHVKNPRYFTLLNFMISMHIHHPLFGSSPKSITSSNELPSACYNVILGWCS